MQDNKRVPSDLQGELRELFMRPVGEANRDRLKQLIERCKAYPDDHSVLRWWLRIKLAHPELAKDLDEAIANWQAPSPPKPVKTPVPETPAPRPPGESGAPQKPLNTKAPEVTTHHPPAESGRPQTRPGFWKKLFGVKEPPKADIAGNGSPRPDPAEPSQTTPPLAQDTATPCQVASFIRAIQSHDLRTAEALIKSNPTLLFSKDTAGMPLLHSAGKYGYDDVAKFLLTNKADVNARDAAGMTPLHWAAKYGRKEVVKLLLANKADTNAKDHEGLTPSDWAARNDYEHLAELLLASNAQADVNARNDNGDTPLHVAAQSGQTAAAARLLASGADVNAKGHYSMTALHWAAYRGDMELVKALVSQGADGNAEDISGQTPISKANRGGHLEVSKFLREHGFKGPELWTPGDLATACEAAEGILAALDEWRGGCPILARTGQRRIPRYAKDNRKGAAVGHGGHA